MPRVIEREPTFQLADEFGRWWARSGWLAHRRIEDGFANWAASEFPRVVEHDEG